MLKFIIDTQLPRRLVNKLQKLGVNAIHTTYFPDGHLLDDTRINLFSNSWSNIIYKFPYLIDTKYFYSNLI